MVKVLVDLLGLAVLAEHTAKDAHAALPDQLEGQASVGRTPALTGAGVPSLSVRRPQPQQKIVYSDRREQNMSLEPFGLRICQERPSEATPRGVCITRAYTLLQKALTTTRTW